MTHIEIPTSAKSGSVLTISGPKTKNFSAGLYKNPKETTVTEEGRTRKVWKGQLIQIEQENSAQEGPLVDGKIHLELKDRKGNAIPTGQYLVKAWIQETGGAFRKDSLVSVY